MLRSAGRRRRVRRILLAQRRIHHLQRLRDVDRRGFRHEGFTRRRGLLGPRQQLCGKHYQYNIFPVPFGVWWCYGELDHCFTASLHLSLDLRVRTNCACEYLPSAHTHTPHPLPHVTAPAEPLREGRPYFARRDIRPLFCTHLRWRSRGSWSPRT